MKGRRAPKGLSTQYRMIGNRVSADISGYTVTCEGETATLSDGVVGVVGGHSFVLSVFS